MAPRRVFPDLKTYLEQTGITQQEFANQLGMTRPHLNHILRGRRLPSLPLAARIAAHANIPIESLLTVSK